MINLSIFQAIGELVSGAKGRSDAEHIAFLAFYRSLVETLPADACRAFGLMNGVEVITGGSKGSFGIELTVTDYVWWKKHIEEEGTTFVHSPASVQLDMLTRLSRKAEVQRLEPSERKHLLDLLEQADA
jgi:hypothetical protein